MFLNYLLILSRQIYNAFVINGNTAPIFRNGFLLIKTCAKERQLLVIIAISSMVYFTLTFFCLCNQLKILEGVFVYFLWPCQVNRKKCRHMNTWKATIWKFTVGGLISLFACSSCITAKEAPKSYGERTKTSKEVRKTMKKSRKQSVKKMKNAGSYNPKTDF